jgi:hypothetical protein
MVLLFFVDVYFLVQAVTKAKVAAPTHGPGTNRNLLLSSQMIMAPL